MIWPSRAVPRVATTIAWVSPRVNSEEPWVRGSTLTLEVIGRTVSRARPSMRTLVASTESRMVRYSSSPNSFDNSALLQPSASARPARRSITSFLIAAMASRRCSLSRTWNASASWLPMASFSAEIRAVFLAGAVHSDGLVPASTVSSLIALMTFCISRWPNITAPSITSSDRMAASDSTISTALAVPATTSSSCDSFSSLVVGLRMYSPFL